MFEILIYGLVVFILLVGATFLTDIFTVTFNATKEKLEKAKADRAAGNALAKKLATKPPRVNPKTIPNPNKLPFDLNNISKATSNGRPITMQELQDLFEGKVSMVTKQANASIDDATEDLNKQLDEALENILKRK